MKARSIIALLVLTGALVAKEWSIKITPPPPAQFTTYQMWSCQITNPEKEAQKVKLHGFIERNGKKIGDATSKPIEMRPGGNRITYRDLKGYEKVWWDKKYEDLAKKGRPLPSGTYYYCIEVIDPKTQKVLAKDCNEVKKKVAHKLRLISPKDGAEIKEEFPTFVWTSPVPPVEGVTYTLRIAEVPKGMPESISEEELMRCPPVHKEKGIKTTTFTYPSSARKLEKGRKYAWQVVAISGDHEICRSEIRKYNSSLSNTEGELQPADNWTFEIKHIKKGKSAALAILKDGEPRMIVYEEFIGENKENVFVAIWPPCYWNICPWPPFPDPLPWPLPDPFLLPKHGGNGKPLWTFEKSLPTHLQRIAHNAPLVIITETYPTSLSKYNRVGVHLKVNDSTYSGCINLWEIPYTKQPFFKFIERQKRLGIKYAEEKKKRRKEKEIPMHLWESLADSLNFSKNSLGVRTLPENTSFGALALWESGITSDAYTDPEEGQKKLRERKFPWGKVVCIVATAGTDILGTVGATTAVGAANVAILKATK